MTIEHKLTIAALIIAFTSPFVKALAERWIAKPAATPDENTPKGQAKPKSRFIDFLMSSGVAIFIMLMTLLFVALLARYPVTRLNVFFIAFGFSSFTFQLMSLAMQRVIKSVNDLIIIMGTMQIMLTGTAESLRILTQPDPAQPPHINPS